MSLAPAQPAVAMSVEEFLALPDDGISRELLRGQLRERGMTVHNRYHSKIEATLARLLGNWLEQQPEPRGEILSGEVGFRLRARRDSLVGIDVAYASAQLVAATPEGTLIFDGPPVLAVEILSPSDRHEDVVEKVEVYKEAGVTVWEVDPDFRTVRVHRAGRDPEMFSNQQELVTEPELPGFRVPVAKIFGR